MLIEKFDHMGYFLKDKVKIAVEKQKWLFVTEKFDEREKKNAKCFSGGCLKLRLRFTEKGKIVWASCCETWQKFEVEVLKFCVAERKKKFEEKKCLGRWLPR